MLYTFGYPGPPRNPTGRYDDMINNLMVIRMVIRMGFQMISVQNMCLKRIGWLVVDVPDMINLIFIVGLIMGYSPMKEGD
jgi:hypothetical protein